MGSGFRYRPCDWDTSYRLSEGVEELFSIYRLLFFHKLFALPRLSRGLSCSYWQRFASEDFRCVTLPNCLLCLPLSAEWRWCLS